MDEYREAWERLDKTGWRVEPHDHVWRVLTPTGYVYAKTAYEAVRKAMEEVE